MDCSIVDIITNNILTLTLLWVAVGEEDELSIKEAADAVVQAMGFEGEVKVSCLTFNSYWRFYYHFVNKEFNTDEN